ncbi:MAG: citrate/2-methylcitrate synthase, partial [Planctomycetota bacterium JB042]
MTAKAELHYDGRTLELPVIEGTEKERAIDISALRKELGLITLDPGYVNTGSCRSAITFIDGEKGILRYRGYPIEQLAERSSFLEVAWLLLHGELPKASELQSFKEDIRLHTMLHEDVKRFFGAFPKKAHPMAICAAVIGALSTFYQNFLDPNDEGQSNLSTHRLLAKVPTIAAYAFKH